MVPAKNPPRTQHVDRRCYSSGWVFAAGRCRGHLKADGDEFDVILVGPVADQRAEHVLAKRLRARWALRYVALEAMRSFGERLASSLDQPVRVEHEGRTGLAHRHLSYAEALAAMPERRVGWRVENADSAVRACVRSAGT